MPNQFHIENLGEYYEVRLVSEDGTKRLTRASIRARSEAVLALGREPRPIILTGNRKFFSAGTDLSEIQSLTAPPALEFAKMGQGLMSAIEHFPASVCAAIHGYCMGGGLDLARACHRRIASPHAVFGHRGAALGLVAGWGGTQRLPRLLAKVQGTPTGGPSRFLTRVNIQLRCIPTLSPAFAPLRAPDIP